MGFTFIEEIIGQGLLADIPLVTVAPIGALYGVTDGDGDHPKGAYRNDGTDWVPFAVETADGFVIDTREIATNGGLDGGGDLTANRIVKMFGYAAATVGFIPTKGATAEQLDWINPASLGGAGDVEKFGAPGAGEIAIWNGGNDLKGAAGTMLAGTNGEFLNTVSKAGGPVAVFKNVDTTGFSSIVLADDGATPRVYLAYNNTGSSPPAYAGTGYMLISGTTVAPTFSIVQGGSSYSGGLVNRLTIFGAGHVSIAAPATALSTTLENNMFSVSQDSGNLIFTFRDSGGTLHTTTMPPGTLSTGGGGGGTVDGSGTGGYIPLWSDTDTLTDSLFHMSSGHLLFNTSTVGDTTSTSAAGVADADFTIGGMFSVLGGAKQHAIENNNTGNNVLSLRNHSMSNAFSALTFLRGDTGREQGAVGYGNPDAGGAAAYPYQSAVFIESSTIADTSIAPPALRFVTTGKIGGSYFQYCRGGFEPEGNFNIYPLISGDWPTALSTPIFQVKPTGQTYITGSITGENMLFLWNKSGSGYSAIDFKANSGVDAMAIGYGNGAASFFAATGYISILATLPFAISQFDSSGGGTQYYRMGFVGDGHVYSYAPSAAITSSDMINDSVSFYQSGGALKAKIKDHSGTVSDLLLGGTGSSVTASGTPVANQLAVWDSSSSVRGSAFMTQDPSTGLTAFAGSLSGNAVTITNTNHSGYSGLQFNNESTQEQFVVGYGNTGVGAFNDCAYIVVSGNNGTTNAKKFVISQYGHYPTNGALIDRISVYPSGHTGISTPAAAVTSSDMANSTTSISIDEVANQLLFTVKLSNGTVKTGVVALV